MIDTFMGTSIIVVEEGKIVGKDKDGNDMIVTDTTAVFNDKNSLIWVTQKMADTLKMKIGGDA